MSRLNLASRAYAAASVNKTTREQEADVFRMVIARLQAARQASPTERVRALADNRRLWIAVGDLVNVANNLGQLQSCQATVDSAPGVAGVLYVVGQALDAAVNAGDYFRLQIRPHEVKTAVS